MQAQRSNDKVLDFLMRMKAEGKIPGILGRLGDLGGIDAKYDIAISTACGRLDNIVTDNYDTATAAIKALKQHNVGRANFIPLNRMEHWRSKSHPINTYVSTVDSCSGSNSHFSLQSRERATPVRPRAGGG